MNKLEEICQKFLLLKKRLDKSDINFLCNHSFKSLACGVKGLYKQQLSPNNNKSPKILNKTEEKSNNKDNNISNIKSNSKNNNKDCLKNLLISLESTKTKSKSVINDKNIKITTNKKNNNNKSPSIKDISNSPTIINEEENHINKKEEIESKSNINNNNNTIPLNEEEDNSNNNINNNNNNNKNNKNSNSKIKKKKINKNLPINVRDKDNKNFDLREKIIENFTTYNSYLSKLVEILPKVNDIQKFYNQNKDKIISEELKNINVIYFFSIKKIIHLCFNTLSKLFNLLAKGTEQECNIGLNIILDIINLIINFIKIIKKHIKNNKDGIDLLFLKDIKSIGNYCLYILILKKNDYEYMLEVQNKKDNDKINEFFNNYLAYFKSVNKLKKILKDNNMFIKHFMIQPSMISFIDIFEMNRKIINYQLNVNFT